MRRAEAITPMLPRASPITWRKTPRILRSEWEWPPEDSSFGWECLWVLCHESWWSGFWEWLGWCLFFAEPLDWDRVRRGEFSVSACLPMSSSPLQTELVSESMSSRRLAAMISLRKLAGWMWMSSALAKRDLEVLVWRRCLLEPWVVWDIRVDSGDVEPLVVESSSSVLVKPRDPFLRLLVSGSLVFGQPAMVFWGKTSATFPPSSITFDVCASFPVACASSLGTVWLWPSSASARRASPPPWPPWLWPCSWKRNSPRTFDASPQQPTISTSLGFETVCGSTKRWMASRKMDTQSATRKTPFTSAPKVSARCH